MAKQEGSHMMLALVSYIREFNNRFLQFQNKTRLRKKKEEDDSSENRLI